MRPITALLLLLPLLATTAPLVHVATSEGETYTVKLPIQPGEYVGYTPGKIAWPRHAVPAVVEPGQSFTLRLAEKTSVEEIVLDDGFGHRYIVDYEEMGEGVYEVKVPENAAKSLYDILVYTSEGLVGEPNAVWVTGKDELEPFVFIHVTDRHYGVKHPNGRTAASYDLAALLIAESIEWVDAVIDTGDIADTASPFEYKEELLHDTSLSIPLFAVPGNHDHVGNSENYLYFVGPWNWTLSLLGLYRLLGIDSGSEGYITMDQADWAYNVLMESKEPVKIVMFHHPHFTHVYNDIPFNFTAASPQELINILLSKKPGSKYTYLYSSWVENPAGRKAFTKLVEGMYESSYKAMIVLSGHVHLNSYAEVHKPDGSTIYYEVSVTTGGSIRPQDYHGFKIIKAFSNGTVDIIGVAPPWKRACNFDTEKVYADMVFTKTAATTYLKIEEDNLLKLMDRVVVYVPVPKEMVEKGEIGLYLRNLDNYTVRCTPIHCVVYAQGKPEKGVPYQVTVFTEKDDKPPSIGSLKVEPRKPRTGQPFAVRLQVRDTGWGLYTLEAQAKLPNGTTVEPLVERRGPMVTLRFPPVLETGTVEVVVKATDLAGNTAEKKTSITIVKPETTTTPTATQATTTTGTTTTTTTTTQETRTTTETTTAPPATTTPQTTETSTATSTPTAQVTTPAKQAEEGQPMLLYAIIVAVAVLAVAAFIVLIRK